MGGLVIEGKGGEGVQEVAGRQHIVADHERQDQLHSKYHT